MPRENKKDTIIRRRRQDRERERNKFQEGNFRFMRERLIINLKERFPGHMNIIDHTAKSVQPLLLIVHAQKSR